MQTSITFIKMGSNKIGSPEDMDNQSDIVSRIDKKRDIKGYSVLNDVRRTVFSKSVVFF